MKQRTNEEIATAWIEYALEARRLDMTQLEKSKNFWAFEEMSRIAFDEPQRALDIVVLSMERFARRRGTTFGKPAMLRLNDEDNFLASLAAGPLEDVLVQHGTSVLDRVRRLAAENPQFAELLAGVWPSDEMPEGVRAVLTPRK